MACAANESKEVVAVYVTVPNKEEGVCLRGGASMQRASHATLHCPIHSVHRAMRGLPQSVA